jgi:sigma-B regulation protein RsbU (phosphoserine phosphatase)
MALGVVADTPFQEFTADIEPGDRVLLYTDGLTEAANARDEEYGEDRVRAWLDAHRSTEDRLLIEGLIEDVLRFGSPVRPRDDMTVMTLTRRSAQNP